MSSGGKGGIGGVGFLIHARKLSGVFNSPDWMMGTDEARMFPP